MTQDTILALGRNTLQVTLILSVPMLLVSLVVGIVIGVLQAATQIHEATVSFVPKIAAFFLVIALLGPWMLTSLVEFTSNLFNSLPNLVH
jgi:flagellar biosynthesis protein FliQ